PEAFAAEPAGSGHFAVRFDLHGARYLGIYLDGEPVVGRHVPEAFAGPDGWILEQRTVGQVGVPCPCGTVTDRFGVPGRPRRAVAERVIYGDVVLRGSFYLPEPAPAGERSK